MSVTKEDLRIRLKVHSRFIRHLYTIFQDALRDPALIPRAIVDYASLQERLSAYEAAYMLLLSQVTDDPTIDDEYGDIMDTASTIKALMSQPPFTPLPTPQTTTKDEPKVPASTQDSFQLTAIKLPTFTGNVTEWNAFYDMFVAAVHSSDKSAVEKFMQLKHYLDGEPLSLIVNLPITSKNYEIAFQILIDRYSDRRLISNFHIDSLLNLPPLTSMGYEEISRFTSAIRKNVAALQANQEPIEHWSGILASIFVRKLNPSARTSFEETLTKHQLPSLDQLLQFLDRKINAQQWQVLAQSSASTSKKNFREKFHSKPPRKPTTMLTSSSKPNDTLPCIKCGDSHQLTQCPHFRAMTPVARVQYATSVQFCFNCLRGRHTPVRCRSTFKCPHCKAHHHPMLHDALTPPAPPSPPKINDEQPSSTVTNYSSATATPTSALLGTALVDIQRSFGNHLRTRAVLDGGSALSYITASCFRKLGLKQSTSDVTVTTFGRQQGPPIQGSAELLISSTKGHQSWTLPVLIVSHITENLPSFHLQNSITSKFFDLDLADPEFHIPAKVDLLIGADLFPYLLTGEVLNRSAGPLALHTHLGYVISGQLSATNNHSNALLIHAEEDQEPSRLSATPNSTSKDALSKALNKFWEIEEVPFLRQLSEEDRQAESIFLDSHQRATDGRYIVPLLFKSEPPILGNSYRAAKRCYSHLRNRLLQNADYQSAYVEFMTEYLSLGHMSLATQAESAQDSGYFIPHHGVFRDANGVQKLRVVFNASKVTSLNTSLNSEMLSGPALQSDIAEIIIRARFHRYIITADIRHMYRQILVLPEHRQFQKILWSPDLKQEPQVYILNTVTYGENCAPFLALRTLRQLAIDEALNFPTASQILLRDVYVDDVVTGSSTIEEALAIKRELIQLLQSAGLELRKWSSNEPTILSDIPPEHCTIAFPSLSDEDSIKILGLTWNPILDIFSYNVNASSSAPTKRMLLSEVAKIYDPLGWLSPTIFLAKSWLQRLWLSSIDWDDRVPEDISTNWTNFVSQLSSFTSLRIQRFFNTQENAPFHLAGFCDASESGYAASIYLITSSSSTVYPSLIIAKSKVAPLKRLSLPRLELCAALLLAKLFKLVLRIIPSSPVSIHAWSDSTVTLHWINTPPHRLKTFVSNRVSKISSILPSTSWHHVRSKENPADCASRGLMPEDLINFHLWWHGPSWLQDSPAAWPTKGPSSNLPPDTVDLEFKPTLLSQLDTPFDLLSRYSSLSRLLHVTHLCLRFIKALKKLPLPTLRFSAEDYNSALHVWIHKTQQESFASELEAIKNSSRLPKQVRKLNPFIDNDGIIRVGGRLTNASVSFDQKHPILLPSRHRLSALIIADFHERYLHPSPRTLQAIISTKFWILSARSRIRHYTSKCLRCFRTNPPTLQPFMGSLPAGRVSMSKPFEHTGVDYGGPFNVTLQRTRGRRCIKSYLVLFICFSTKAVHLELASDLSTSTFLLAFKRFLSRRGKCAHIYSDAGTNFIGAKNYLDELQSLVVSDNFNDTLSTTLSPLNVQWHVNPPGSPHFGGLWESNIKSVKSHLRKTIGETILTYEEFTTLLCQIEAVLNSRPLCPLSSEPDDLEVLTPFHFLLNEPGATLLDQRSFTAPESHLTRWQLTQRILSSFWKRWKTDYLCQLQERSKWTSRSVSPRINDLVLIRAENLPPLQWRMGRIVALHPGADNITRVATVRTKNGTLTRALVKLALLPCNEKPPLNTEVLSPQD